MDKRGQMSVAAIILIVIAMILIIAMVLIVVLRPDFFAISTQKPQTTGNVVKDTNYQNQVTCNYPYIKVGLDCCLDKNSNGICDKDEAYIQTPDKTNTNTLNCYAPYIKRGSACCLDRDSNGICDINEDYYSGSSSNSRVTHDDMDSPFDLRSIEFTKDELNFDLKNTEDTEVTVTSVSVDDCDDIDTDKVIAKNKVKSFSFDCDFGSKIDSDIEVKYIEEGSNTTLTATGNIRGDFRRVIEDNYYNDPYLV